MEKEEGGEEQQKKDGRRSSGRRVSDLLDKFEERGATIDDGGTGGSHILKPGVFRKAVKFQFFFNKTVGKNFREKSESKH